MAAKIAFPLSLILSVAILSFSSVNAVQLDLIGRRKNSLFRKRDESGTFGNGSLALRNEQDISYSCNVTLGGRDFEVSIDTGRTMSISFAKGDATGNINTARLEFDGFTIQNQAYLKAETTQDLGDTDGILGLGPSSASGIRTLLNSSSGDPPLDQIFKQNMNTPSFLTFLLSRNGTAEGSSSYGFSEREKENVLLREINEKAGMVMANKTGRACGSCEKCAGARPQCAGINSQHTSVEKYPAQLTIGTVTSGLEAILNAPKLPALTDQFGPLVQHWLTLLDADGIIGPDGQKIQTQTNIRNPTAGTPDQLHVMFDSGFSIPQLPGSIVDKIYGQIPGAQFFSDAATITPDLEGLENVWRIPCDYEVNVSFVFAGQEFPISPLDLSVDVGEKDSSGEEICISFFQQIDANIEGNPDFGTLDMILGMGFLRNTYILFNFGDFVDGSADNVADPYIQLLSVNDKSQNHIDFVNARLNGKVLVLNVQAQNYQY
ncbi:acid protease [Dendrothele bispora CBS 962.96]|uniref:Acid protease n=1 Tax=Dendrothele bispora (strain CBS 962.96) TaxID=1314807 RepID=A0A4S8LBT0_DENBC|nr:acid protease [Dendrothele bispora CBS 962.96]